MRECIGYNKLPVIIIDLSSSSRWNVRIIQLVCIVHALSYLSFSISRPPSAVYRWLHRMS